MKQFFYESIDSTNDEAKRLLMAGEQDFCILAARQSAGKGSRGRSFLSEEGGLYLSVVLPKESVSVSPTILGAAAAAVAMSRLCGRQLGCKWVNDLILEGKKVGGVLAEVCGDFIVLGIGVNLNQTEFPSELSHVSSLKLCCGRSFDWQAAQRALLQQLESFAADGDAAFGAYSARLLTLGRSVVVHSEGSARRAQALALEKSGALRLRWEDSGREELLLSGQVSLRAEQSYL